MIRSLFWYSSDIHFVGVSGCGVPFFGVRLSRFVSSCLSAICRRGTVNAVDQRALRVRALKDGDLPIMWLGIGRR
jgi:hypothetical protein